MAYLTFEDMLIIKLAIAQKNLAAVKLKLAELDKEIEYLKKLKREAKERQAL